MKGVEAIKKNVAVVSLSLALAALVFLWLLRPDVVRATPTSLAGLWHFDEGSGTTAFDSSGNGNNGTIVDATYVPGKFRTALSFDGVDDFVDAGNATSLQVSAGDFTVEGWVNFNSLVVSSSCDPNGCDMSIVDKMSGPVGVGANPDGWRLFKQQDNHFWFCLGGSASVNGCSAAPGISTTVRSTTVATTNTWFHVAGVKTSTAIKIYVNGALEATTTLGSFTDTNSTDVLIGKNAPEGALLNGLVDEVHIWARALSSAEIGFLAGANKGELFVPSEISQTLGSGAVFSSEWDVGTTTPAMGLAFIVPDVAGTTISTIAFRSAAPKGTNASLSGFRTGISGLAALITAGRGSIPSKTLHLKATLSDSTGLGMQFQWSP